MNVEVKCYPTREAWWAARCASGTYGASSIAAILAPMMDPPEDPPRRQRK